MIQCSVRRWQQWFDSNLSKLCLKFIFYSSMTMGVHLHVSICTIVFLFFYGECSPCPLFILWVPQDRREKEGPQCLKWAVSQRPWSFPSCRNLITNNRWHIRGREMQGRFVCARTKRKCARWCVLRKKWQKKEAREARRGRTGIYAK